MPEKSESFGARLARTCATALRAAAFVAAAFGAATSFVVGVDLVRWMRAGVLLDPEPSWAWIRLALGLAAVCGAGAAGVVAAVLFRAWARWPDARAGLEPLPFRSSTLAALTVAAILAGIALRFAALVSLPPPLWVDDLSLIRPALELSGRPADFADAIRAAPYGVARPYGSVGVLYLEGFRAALRLCGTTIFGIRLPSAAAGVASLLTAACLGRALLPSGGGMLTALILSGLRWHLILSRWSWVMIALAPILDIAALFLLSARRRRSVPRALAAGLVAGLGAHVYLSAWPAGAALALFAMWPSPSTARESARPRLARAGAFVLGFAACAAPLFLLRQGRSVSYFARSADHNVAIEMVRTRSLLPPWAAAADALASPWFLADPTPRHDLPGRSRLGLLLGAAAAITLARALLVPREDLSGLLLAHGAAYVAATAAGGMAEIPNGARFAYLSTLAAVAAAGGVLWAISLVPAARRHTAALAAVGVLSVAGAMSSRDALVLWAENRATFRSFFGEDTLVGRAAFRWGSYGDVAITPGVGHSPLAIEAVRRYRLEPFPPPAGWPAAPARLSVRIVPPGAPPRGGERVVEKVEDTWGRRWAVVLARKAAP